MQQRLYHGRRRTFFTHRGKRVKLRMLLALLLTGTLSVTGCDRNDPGPKASASKAADIQREAQSHPESPPPEYLPSNFEEGVPGTAERRCVEVNRLLEETGRDGAIRSGELVAGSFPPSSAAGPHTTRTNCGLRRCTRRGCRGSR